MEKILYIVLAILFLAASSSSFFGKNLPRVVWWISIISAGLAGFVFGMLLAPFPDGLLFGAFAAVGAIFLVLIMRVSRRNQPR